MPSYRKLSVEDASDGLVARSCVTFAPSRRDTAMSSASGVRSTVKTVQLRISAQPSSPAKLPALAPETVKSSSVKPSTGSSKRISAGMGTARVLYCSLELKLAVGRVTSYTRTRLLLRKLWFSAVSCTLRASISTVISPSKAPAGSTSSE